MKKILLILTIGLFAINSFSQGGTTCSGATPFCGNSGTNTLIYPNATDTGNQAIPDPACLGSTPNASWFYFKVDQTGPLVFDLIQNTQFNASGDPIGTPLDVDFAVWGPFASPTGNCGSLDNINCPSCPNNTSDPGYYPAGNLIDCSYDAAPVETVTINGATNGQYYLIIVTNYANDPGFIKLAINTIATPQPDPTDCELVCGVTLGNNQTIFCGTPVTLTATFVSPPTSGTPTYQWLLNGVPQPIYDGQNPITVNTPGTWTVKAVRPGGCFEVTDSVLVDQASSGVVMGDPQPLNLCTSATSGPYVFSPLPVGQYATINQNATMLGALNPADYTFTYYTTFFDADNGNPVNIISPANQANYSINTTSATVWVRVEDVDACYVVKSFTLNVFSTPGGTFSYPNTPYCASVTSALPTTVGLTPGGQYILSPTTPGLVIVDADTGEINPSTSATGTFTVEYVIPAVGSCLEYRTPATVTINPAPVAPGVTTPVDYCQGDAATPLVATGSNLLWYTTSTGGTGNATAPTPSTTTAGSTSYFVSQTVGGCEGPRAEIVVNVNAPPPPPSVNSLIDYCQGDTATQLTVTSGTNLLWYTTATGGTGSATAPTPSTTTPGSTTYYVTQTNLGCESARASITVNIITLPTAPGVTSPVDYCQNATASALTATGTNLLWYTTATGGTGSATAPTPITTAVGSTTYYVSQTVTNCEGPRASIVVNVTAVPLAPGVTTPVTYCQGATATALTATGTSLLWYTVATGGTGSATAPTPNTTASGSTTYYVSQTVSGCESPRASIVVNITPTPSAPGITTPVIYCQGATATALTATGTSLLWYTTATGGTGSATAPTPSTVTAGSTSYYVTQTVSTCESPRAEIVVTITPLPTAPGVTSPVGYCQGATASALTATGTNLLWYTTATGGTGSATAPTPSTAAVGSTTYYVSQTVTNCEGPRASIVVNVTAAPLAPGVTSPVPYCQNATATALTATGTGLLWYTVATGGTGSATAPTPNTTAAGSTTYYVSQTVSGCEGPRASIEVKVTATPKPILTPGNICVDNAGVPIGNYTIETQLDDTNYTFVWSDANGVIVGATQSFYVANVPGTYSVVASSNTTPACPSVSTSVTIGTLVPPSSISSIETSEYFADIKTITVNVLPVGAYEYQLDNGDFQSSNVFTNVSPGPHTITVRNDCDQLPSQDVYIVDYPRYFTPNADGYHETWNIPVLSGQPNSKVLIFDRFGKLLKQIQPSGSGWDGTFNGQALPATDYWFVVTYEEKGISKEFRSHFSIKR